MNRLILTLLRLFFLTSLLTGGIGLAGASAAASDLSVDFFAKPYAAGKNEARLQAGTDLKAGFSITDRSGRGVSHLHPMGWITLREAGKEKPDQNRCEEKVKGLLRGGVTQADADLNGFYLLTLNADNSVSIINPLVNLGATNILAVLLLKEKAAGWEMDDRSGVAYVTLPNEGKVAMVDIHARAVKGYLKVGEGPERIRRQPDGRYLWVAHQGSGALSVIDPAGRSVIKTLPVGKGPFDFSFDSRSRFVFVGGADGRVSTIQTDTFQKEARIKAGKGPLSLAYSPSAETLYAADRSSGAVLAISPESGKVLNKIMLAPGIQSLHSTPDGRFILALNPVKKTVTLIDTTRKIFLRALPTEADPDQIFFSADYAYIHHNGSPNVGLLALSSLSEERPLALISVPVGVRPSEEASDLSALSPMAMMPDGSGVLIANRAEKTIYFYMEGMNAPMNSFKAHTSPPMGLLVYDRSLKEGPVAGRYESLIRLEEGGGYDVSFFLPDPQTAACFELTVAADPTRPKKKSPPLFDSRFDDLRFRPGKPSKLQFELSDAETGRTLSGVKDAQILAFLQNGGWQARAAARSIGRGIYEAELIFPREGKYHVLVEAPSLGIRFGDVRHVFATVSEEGSSPSETEKPEGRRSD